MARFRRTRRDRTRARRLRAILNGENHVRREIHLRLQVDLGRSHCLDCQRRRHLGLFDTPVDQAQIVELVTGIGGIIGSVMAIYGRIVATKKIA